jgi:hypothetical protein
VAAAASQVETEATESATVTAASSSASACTDQPSARQSPSSPSPPSAASSESETAPACTSSILSPAAATRTSTRSAANSEHPFFRWLLRAPASDAAAQHFRRHFLQSSPMCICTLYPVYSSKVDLQPLSNPSARRFLQSLSHLCLACITFATCHEGLSVLKPYITRAMSRDFHAYYDYWSDGLYLDADRARLHYCITQDEKDEQQRDIRRRLVPLMGQHGWQLHEEENGRFGTWTRRLSPESADKELRREVE